MQLVNARQGLLDLQTGLQNRDEHAEVGTVKKMHERLLKKIAVEIARLEAAIEALIKATPHFAELAEIIESVPGLQARLGGLIAMMPELGQVNSKIIAALLGGAPYETTAASGGASATSRVDGVESATSSTWRV